MGKKLTIGWKVSTLDPSLASLRYRALFPILALEKIGFNNKIFRSIKQNCLVDIDVLVIVKSFTLEDYSLAQSAVKIGIPVVFDLCDNIFIEKYKGKKKTSPAEIFVLISEIASAIVVTTESLAEIVNKKIDRAIPVYVVPDGVGNPFILRSAKNRIFWPRVHEQVSLFFSQNLVKQFISNVNYKLGVLKASSCHLAVRLVGNNIINIVKENRKSTIAGIRKYFNGRFWLKLAYCYYDSIRSNLTGVPPKLVKNQIRSKELASKSTNNISQTKNYQQILWFGNHGAAHADFGMLDLLIIRNSLEKLASEIAVELVVVSNNLEKYNKFIGPMTIPSRYIEWSAESMEQYLNEADVVVVPNSLDSFSICKSSNRTVLALSHGVPVVATSTPALEALRECIELDDFEGGIRRYLTDREHALSHVKRGQKLIEKLYGQSVIGRLWASLLSDVVDTTISLQNKVLPEIIIAIHLPQDIDLARPVLNEIRQRGIPCSVWTSISAMKRWPGLGDSIKNLGVDWNVLSDELKDYDASIFPTSTYALLSVSETNLNPHRFTHQLTRLANSAGLFTATMQHGYENVGLNYTDDVHDIRNIRFASSKIYLWGGLDKLHPHILPETRNKCIPTGCPKSIAVDQYALIECMGNDRPTIGVFENLHWHRYSGEYRDFFLESVWKMANKFPGVNFLVKPHNAGMWLTSRYQGDKPKMKNLMIVDPKDSQWTSITAPQLFESLIAVITTPSTVALDAARVKIPTAVVALEMDLNNYEPLPLFRSIEHWESFICQVLDIHHRELLQEKTQQFLERALLPGNAAWRIVEEIVSRNRLMESKNSRNLKLLEF